MRLPADPPTARAAAVQAEPNWVSTWPATLRAPHHQPSAWVPVGRSHRVPGERSRSQVRVTYEETIRTVPGDPDKAWNYQALLALWEEQRIRTEVSPEQLGAWSQSVLGLLRFNERQLFLDQ